MNDSVDTCPKCGVALSSTAPEGLCPRCLFGQLAEPAATEGLEDATHESGPNRAWANETVEFGDYELLEELGQGGMGMVYRARQLSLNRPAAVKVIKLGMDTRQVVARFEAERQALARMDHPNIAKVFDAGVTETGRPYFAMELVPGLKITEYCDRHRLSTRHRLELFIQVCEAVQHAHQKGIIHRDLKPSNILVIAPEDLASVGFPKIIDFGIAKAVEGRLTDDTLFTAFEQFLGTPAYMSPEQATLTAVDVDTRSDIYSLGVLLYELLTGQTPFDTKALLASGLDELRRTIREIDPVRPSSRLTQARLSAGSAQSEIRNPRSEIDNDLDWIVMKCLEKERDRRYETANGLALDIRRHLNHEPVMARPPSRLYEFQRTVRRHWVGFAVTAVIIGVLCAGISLSLWQAGVANSAKHDALAAVAEANRRLHESLLAQARSSRLSGQPHPARESIEAAAKLNPTSETRDEAIAVLAMSGLGEVQSWCSLPLSYEFPDFSADLSRCGYVSQAGLIVRETSDWKEIARFQTPGDTIGLIDLSDDGNYVAVLGHRGNVWIFDIQNQKEIFKTNIQFTQTLGGIAFAPDGNVFAVVDGFPRLQLFSVPAGNLLQSLPLGIYGTPRFHPNGRQIAVASQNGVQVVDWQTGDVSHRLGLPSQIRRLSWHPGGSGLAISLFSDEILVWDITRERTKTIAVNLSAYTMDFSHKGDMLITGSYPSQLWSVSPFRQLSSTLGGVGLKFARNDLSLAFHRSTFGLGIWNVVRSSVCHRISELSEKANSGPGLGFSIDGRYVGLTTETEFQIWDWREHRVVDTKPSQRAHSLIFHPTEPGIIVTSFDGVHQYPLRYAANGSLERLDEGEPLANLPQNRFYRGSITSNGELLAIANPMMTLVYDLRDRRIVRRLETKNVTSVKISPDGRQLVTSTYRGDGSRAWNIATGEEVRRLSYKDGHTSFSADGRWLACYTSARLDVWKTSSWTRHLTKELASEAVTGAGAIEFSPDGRFLAAIDMHMPTLLLDPETGDELGRLTLPTPMRAYSAAFSADAAFLALAGPDGACVWDLATLRKELAGLGLAVGRLPGAQGPAQVEE